MTNMTMHIKSIYFILISIVFWMFLVIFYNSNEGVLDKLICLAILVNILNIILIIQTYKIPIMLIFSLYILNYSYIFTIPAFYSTKISGVATYNNNSLLINVLMQMTIAIYILNFLFFVHKKKFIKNRYLSDKIILYENKNSTNFLYSTFGFLGFSFFMIFNNSGKQTNLPFNFTFEYIFMFVIIYKIYSSKNMMNKIIIHFMLISICAKTLLSAGRIEVIEALVLLIIFYYEKKLKAVWIALGSVVLNVLMELLFIVRNTNGDSSWATSKIFFNRMHPPTLILGNEGDVTQSSMAMVGIVQDHVVTFYQRLKSFMDMIISQFLPLGNFEVFRDSNVSRYIQQVTVTLGGGYIFSQWYFWLGFVGVILVAFLINTIIKTAYLSSKASVLSISCIYSIVLFTRWYAYFFDFIIKIPIVLFYILIIFTTVFRKKQIK